MDILIILASLALGIADEIKASPYYESKQEREANAASVQIYRQYQEQERKRKEEFDKKWKKWEEDWDKWMESRRK